MQDGIHELGSSAVYDPDFVRRESTAAHVEKKQPEFEADECCGHLRWRCGEHFYANIVLPVNP